MKLEHRQGPLVYALARIGGKELTVLRFNCEENSISALQTDRWQSEDELPPRWFLSHELDWFSLADSAKDPALLHICALEVQDRITSPASQP